MNQEFLEVLFPDLKDGFIEVRLIHSTNKTIQTHFYSSIEELVAHQSIFDDCSKKFNIYFGVCPRSKKEGNKESVKSVPCLWVDLDFKNSSKNKVDLLDYLRKLPIRPTVIVESGHGFHLYWRLRELIEISTSEDIKKIEIYLKALAKFLEGDSSSAELARVLRFPGTFNVKDPAHPLEVGIIECDPNRQYNLSDFETFIDVSFNDSFLSTNNQPGWIAETLSSLCDGNRNASFAKIIGRLHSDRWTSDDISTFLSPHAEKCGFPLEELRHEVESICRRYQHNSFISFNSPPTEWVKPLYEDAYYGLAGDFVRIIEPHTESDPVAILAQSLTYFGNVIGNKTHFKVEATEHHLKLNCALAGPTSKGRKGTAHNIVNYTYRSVDSLWVDENIVSGLSSGEGVISALSDQDTTKQDKRLLIVEQEFSSTLKVMAREGNILSGIIRQAWDGKDLRNLTKNNPLRASNTHISIIAHITITELKKYLNETERANGFGNRFLYFLVRRSKCLPEGGQFHTLDFGHLVNRLREAVNFAKTVDEIKRNNEATQIWREIYPLLSEGKPGVVGDLTARAEAYVMRIACIYALLDCSAVIRPEHLKAALAVWEYSASCVEFIFGDCTGNHIADKIYIALKATKEGLPKTDINDLFKGNRTAAQINIALDILVMNKKAFFELVPSNGGRDIEIWRVTK